MLYRVTQVYLCFRDEEEKTAWVKKSSINISGDIVIPYECVINGKTYRVTAIWDAGFDGCYKMTSVIIPKSVTKLNANAFGYCNDTKFYIPSSVTEIAPSAFTGSVNIEIYYEGTAEQWEKFGNLDLAVPLVNIYYGWSDVTKKYVDEKIGDIDNALEELHTYAQALIGGEA